MVLWEGIKQPMFPRRGAGAGGETTACPGGCLRAQGQLEGRGGAWSRWNITPGGSRAQVTSCSQVHLLWKPIGQQRPREERNRSTEEEESAALTLWCSGTAYSSPLQLAARDTCLPPIHCERHTANDSRAPSGEKSGRQKHPDTHSSGASVTT